MAPEGREGEGEGQGMKVPQVCPSALTSHQGEEEDHDKGVPKVQGVGESSSDGSLVHKVVNREEKQIEPSSGRGEKGTPPPAVVLRAEVEVAEEDGGLSTHHQEDQEGQHDEAKHVVHLPVPDT